MWWKLLLAFLLILAIAGSSALAQISGTAASDSCGGCDTSPAWAEAGWVVAGVALLIWTGVLIAAVIRWTRRHHPARDRLPPIGRLSDERRDRRH